MPDHDDYFIGDPDTEIDYDHDDYEEDDYDANYEDIFGDGRYNDNDDNG